MEDFIKELEAKLKESFSFIMPLRENGASYEELADKYEYAFDLASEVADRAINELKALSRKFREESE